MVSRGDEALDVAAGQGLLDLTLFEVGNSLWKLKAIHGRLTEEDAASLLGVVSELSKHMSVLSVATAGLPSILGLALRERASFYDSAYVHIARERAFELVTDDARLARMASKYVTTRRSSEL